MPYGDITLSVQAKDDLQQLAEQVLADHTDGTSNADVDVSHFLEMLTNLLRWEGKVCRDGEGSFVIQGGVTIGVIKRTYEATPTSGTCTYWTFHS